MNVDFPIGTRLSLNNRSLEIVEDSKDTWNYRSCRQCALRYAEEASSEGCLCVCTRCIPICGDEERADGKFVHWAFAEGSV